MGKFFDNLNLVLGVGLLIAVALMMGLSNLSYAHSQAQAVIQNSYGKVGQNVRVLLNLIIRLKIQLILIKIMLAKKQSS